MRGTGHNTGYSRRLATVSLLGWWRRRQNKKENVSGLLKTLRSLERCSFSVACLLLWLFCCTDELSPLGSPTALEELVPRALCDAAQLVIGQFATAQFVCQHFAESSALFPWN